MNKILYWIKYILMIITFILNIVIAINISNYLTSFILYLILFIIFLVKTIKDVVLKNNFRYDKIYNILSILSLLLITFVLSRTLIDPSFINNSKEYYDIIKSYYTNVLNRNFTSTMFNYTIYLYVRQNLIYFIISLLSVLIYRKINIKQNDKYSSLALVCFYVSISSLYFNYIVMNIFYGNVLYLLIYLIFNIILVGTEIFDLVKLSKNKKKWIIYLSFVFNLLSFYITISLLLK